MTFTVAPIGGLSLRPVFDDWEADELAEVLSFFLGYPLEAVMPEPGRTATWLQNSDGTVRHFKANDEGTGQLGRND